MNAVNDIFLLLLNLFQIKNREEIKRIFVDSINHLYKNLDCIFSENENTGDNESFEISTGKNSFGFIIINKNCLNKFKSNEISDFRNAVKMLAIILENKLQKEKLEEENVELEKDVKENKEMLLNIVKIVPSIIYIYDINNFANIYINNEWIKILGYSSEELNNFGSEILTELIHPDDQDKIAEHIKKLIKLNKDENLEIIYRMKDKNKKWHWLFSRETPYKYDEKGNILQILGCANDITNLKKASTEKEKLLEEIKIKNEELKSILYVTSHDLRSPLVNIQGFSNELVISCNEIKEAVKKINLEEDVISIIDNEMPEYLNYINTNIEKMDRLLKGLLVISRINTKMISMNKIEMNKLMNEIVNNYKFQLKDNNVEIDYKELPDCFGNENQINQVFSNIIDNAIKYSKPGEKNTIKISGAKKNSFFEYCIEDNGIGIDPKHHKKIFEIFYRLNPKNKLIGEGLGLTIVKRIIDRHNGKVWIESAENQGSKFCILLPDED